MCRPSLTSNQTANSLLIAKATADFFINGGQISHIDMGVSGQFVPIKEHWSRVSVAEREQKAALAQQQG